MFSRASAYKEEVRKTRNPFQEPQPREFALHVCGEYLGATA
ncbi:unnamed protein product [Pylaiella littoralis]